MALDLKTKKNIKQHLIRKFRLVVLDEETFEERLSFKINRLNILVYGGVFSILLVTLTSVIIAYSPIKEYIPGYSSTYLKQKASFLVYKTDSLEQVLKANDAYLEVIRKVLTGQLKTVPKIRRDSILNQKQLNPNDKILMPSALDSSFREQVELESRYSLFDVPTKSTKQVFFAPLLGKITNTFNGKKKHYAIDVTAKSGTPIKAVADGTIIFSEWTADTGYVIMIIHTNGFISVYKHNALALKRQGDLVASGEVIATVGNTGEYSTGPHLHFELWKDGFPVDPSLFIDFE